VVGGGWDIHNVGDKKKMAGLGRWSYAMAGVISISSGHVR